MLLCKCNVKAGVVLRLGLCWELRCTPDPRIAAVSAELTPWGSERVLSCWEPTFGTAE